MRRLRGLETEVHKLKSVLQQTQQMEPRDPLSSLGKVGQLLNSKKQGVSGESSTNGQTANDIQIQRYDKDFRSKQLIKAAIMDNDFLKNLDTLQVKEMVESMHQAEYKADSYVITEGEAGNDLFVSAEGEFQVIKDGKILAVMGPGKAFGELAILYNCTRTASIRALTPCKVWMLDRRVFQKSA
ncbi:cGMP-dependent protein kinase, isozyme 1-like [Diaphorina citri]|uniref:cAMP-dependent protein kinase type II-alpha regulatory subunit n=1 Tax=Diaphorina citri TaxID=121845 RepID=A0A3Q0IZH5_DIACI|nr:cGMP-dependent protein kinase, isozyme 1-like [Diaphorina citri]